MFMPYRQPTLSVYSSLYDILIPEDHPLRVLRKSIDFSDVVELLKKNYSMEFGAWSESPDLLLRMLVLKSKYRLSDRDLCDRSRTDMAFKFFLGLNPEDDLIEASTLSKFRTKRLKEINLLDILIEKSVKFGISQKVLDTKDPIIVDGTHVKSRFNQITPVEYLAGLAKEIRKMLYRSDDEAKWKRVFPEKVKTNSLDDMIEYCRSLIYVIRMEPKLVYNEPVQTRVNFLEEKLDDIRILMEESMKEAMAQEAKKKARAAAQQKQVPQAGNETIPKSESHSKEATAVKASVQDKPMETKQLAKRYSRDEDARTGHKTKDTSFFGYKLHLGMSYSGIVVSAVTTSGQVNEGEQLPKLVEKARLNGMDAKTVIGDTAYSGKDNLKLANQKDNNNNRNFALVSKLNPKISAASLNQERDGFSYNKDAGMFVCPMGHMAVKKIRNRTAAHNKNPKEVYYFDGSQCVGCPYDGKCHKRGKKYRTYAITIPSELHAEQQKFQETEEFKAAMAHRYKIEAKNNDLKHQYGLEAAYSSGLFAMQIQGAVGIYTANMMRIMRLVKEKQM